MRAKKYVAHHHEAIKLSSTPAASACRLRPPTPMKVWPAAAATVLDVRQVVVSSHNLSLMDMRWMFEVARSFNQPLNKWNVSKVEDMNSMFEGARSFNQPLNKWNVSNVENMGSMFSNATSFNQPLNNWDVSNVEDMEGMFLNANSFNQPLYAPWFTF